MSSDVVCTLCIFQCAHRYGFSSSETALPRARLLIGHTRSLLYVKVADECVCLMHGVLRPVDVLAGAVKLFVKLENYDAFNKALMYLGNRLSGFPLSTASEEVSQNIIVLDVLPRVFTSTSCPKYCALELRTRQDSEGLAEGLKRTKRHSITNAQTEVRTFVLSLLCCVCSLACTCVTRASPPTT